MAETVVTDSRPTMGEVLPRPVCRGHFCTATVAARLAAGSKQAAVCAQGLRSPTNDQIVPNSQFVPDNLCVHLIHSLPNPSARQSVLSPTRSALPRGITHFVQYQVFLPGRQPIRQLYILDILSNRVRRYWGYFFCHFGKCVVKSRPEGYIWV